MGEISRRDLMKAGLATGVLAWTAGCRPPHEVTQALGAAGTGKRPLGPVVWRKSACLQCPAGCGIRVKTIQGSAIKIEGLPDHPINAGRLCPKGQAGLQVLYDPDRIHRPLKRTGKRGSGEWAWISWEDAVREIGERLAAFRKEEGPHTLLAMGGRFRGRMRTLFERFTESYGTPNLVDNSSTGSWNLKLANRFATGVTDFPCFDWKNADYVLAFGASLIEASRPTVYLQRMVAHLRRGRTGRRARIVVVDPRHSVTASKSDEWVPIRPGTDGALALGMAHVIVKRKRHDEKFLRERTSGFDRWRKEILDGFTAEHAAQETGIPAETIERLAMEFTGNGAAFAVAGRGAGMHTNGLYNLMAVQCLNALVGNLDAPGGWIFPETPSFTDWPDVEKDETARKGLSRPRLDGAGTARFPLARSVASVLPEAIRSGQPYRTNAVLLYYTNPLFSTPNPERFRKALEEVPLVVSFSPFLDDSASMADYILPDHTYLERWQLDVPDAGADVPVVTLRRPAVEPLYDTRDTADVLMDIARAIGGSVAAAFPWKNHREAIRSSIGATARAAGVGEKKFWEELLKKGFWSGKEYLPGGRSRFEFVSERMRAELSSAAAAGGTGVEALAARLGVRAKGDAIFMAHYEPPEVPDGKEGRFHLNPYKTMTHAEGRGANQPWLHEIYGVQLTEYWDPWVEVNPHTAHELGLHDDDPVRLESPLGWIRARVRVFPGAMPDVLSLPYEYGHRAKGRWVTGGNGNPNFITKEVLEGLTGVVSRSATRVNVVRISGEGHRRFRYGALGHGH